jgi:tetratricopeptide (TPR) repeat protein
MELVKGIPITKYCDEHRLTPRERLELFVPVCQAMQHAHQKGIIHRDVKPSNVLVAPYDGKPVVKVIDFGVAKATGQRLTERTLFTGFGAVVGTLEYMSPEQAELNNQDIDMRSDIYSLGVLLYELLTGTTPLDRKQLKQAAFTEMLRIIREVEPPKPSTRLSNSKDSLPSISAQRQMEPAKLTKLVRGELDWIVMKALEKDRNRRYETANGFAMDVERYLTNEPVLAVPPSTGYRLRKFARKNRRLLATVGAFVGLLLVAVIGLIIGLIAVNREQQKTRTALDAEKTAKGQARDALDALTDDVVETMFARQPELGEKEKAFLRKVLTSYQAITQELGETAEARLLRARGFFCVAHLHALLGDQVQAEARYRQAVPLQEELANEFPGVAEYRQNLAQTHESLGIALAELGKQAEGESAFRRAIALRHRLVEDFPNELTYRSKLAISYSDLSKLLRLQRKLGDAEEACRQALDLDQQLAAESSTYQPALARSRSNLGQILREQARYAEAEEALRQALIVQQKQVDEFPAVPKGRWELALSYDELGIVLAELGKPAEAEAAFRQNLDLRKKLADDFPKVLEYRGALAGACNNLGYLLWRQKQYAEAEEAYRQSLDLQEKLVAEAGAVPGHRQDLARSYDNLGYLMRDLMKFVEAETAFRRALAHQMQLVDNFPEVVKYQLDRAATQFHLGQLFRLLHRPAEALPWYEQALAFLQPVHTAAPKDLVIQKLLGHVRWDRARSLDELQKSAEALLDWERAVELVPKADRPQVRLGRARAWVQAGKAAEAVAETDAVTKDPATPSALCCVAAGVYSLASAAVQETSRREAYAGQALALLRRAQAAGFFKDRAMVADLNQHADLAPLRPREDFQKFVAELEAPAKP